MVVRAVHRLGTQALVHADTKELSPILLLTAFMAAIASVLGINFFIPLGVGGIVNTIWEAGGEKRKLVRHIAAAVILALSVVAFVLYRVFAGDGSVGELTATGLANTNPPEYWALFVVGLIAGLVTFGGAFTTIPLVRAETSVWLLPSVFLDSIGLAQCLPTPLVMFVCFVGYMGRGIGGALLMTLGIFLPAFSFTLIGHNLFERLVKFGAIRYFLDGVTAAVIGLVGFTALELLRDTVAIQVGTVVIFVVSIGTLYQITSVWTAPSVLVGAAIAGQVLLVAQTSQQ
jgi:chromate transporter